jgi:hypothetical protein
MVLLPKSSGEFARSVAVPLSIACAVLSVAAVLGPFGSDGFWRHYGAPLARALICFGFALGFTCSITNDSDRVFQKWVLVGAVVAILLGIISFPALTD